MIGWLVSWFSKEPYYANYERNLEKIAQEVKDLEELNRLREYRKATLVSNLWQYGLILWACSMVYAFWIQQLEEGILTPQQHAIRVAPALFLLPLLFVLHFIMGTLLGMGDKRNSARLTRLHRSKKKTIEDLKEYTKFDKVLTIIKQYDPDTVPRIVGGQIQQPGLKNSNNQQQKNQRGNKSGGGVGVKQNGLAQEGGKKEGKKSGEKASEPVQNRLLPLFDRFAGFMGDNPGLLAELSHVKQALHEAQDRARCAEEEVKRLKEELALLKREEEEGEIDGLMDALDNNDTQQIQQQEKLIPDENNSLNLDSQTSQNNNNNNNVQQQQQQQQQQLQQDSVSENKDSKEEVDEDKQVDLVEPQNLESDKLPENLDTITSEK